MRSGGGGSESARVDGLRARPLAPTRYSTELDPYEAARVGQCKQKGNLAVVHLDVVAAGLTDFDKIKVTEEKEREREVLLVSCINE